MGELLFCNEPIAAMPYYIENVSLNVYTIEELCYYIKTNTYMLERSFMNEELCTWIDKQIKMPYLAKRLRELMMDQGALYEYVFEIIKTSGYCTIQEMQDIVLAVRQIEEKTDFECKKLRADKLLEEGKYISSIYEYNRLLESNDAQKESKLIIGNIWHNLGTAYCRLFLFRDAASCYNNAYKLNKDLESIKSCIKAYECAHEDSMVSKISRENDISDIMLVEIINELSISDAKEDVFKLDIKSSSEKILEWKEEYRKHAFF